MSKLRQHLQSARSDYNAIQYAGDLAADVLARQHQRQWSRWIVLAGSVAAAAVVAIVVFTRSAPDKLVTSIPQPTDEAVVEVVPAISISALSSDDSPMLLVPPAPVDFSFSMPSITFVGEDSSDASPTTQESV